MKTCESCKNYVENESNCLALLPQWVESFALTIPWEKLQTIWRIVNKNDTATHCFAYKRKKNSNKKEENAVDGKNDQ